MWAVLDPLKLLEAKSGSCKSNKLSQLLSHGSPKVYFVCACACV